VANAYPSEWSADCYFDEICKEIEFIYIICFKMKESTPIRPWFISHPQNQAVAMPRN